LFAALPRIIVAGAPTGQAVFLGNPNFADFAGEAATVVSEGRNVDMREELVSPRIDCSGRSGVTLSWHHGYRSHVGQFVDVLVTLDGGTTFSLVYGDGVSAALCPDVCDATPVNTVNNKIVTVDLSALADGRPDVRVAFRFYGDNGADQVINDGFYWAIEDFAITAATGDLFREGFDTPSAMTTADCGDPGRWCVNDDGDVADPGPLSSWYWGTRDVLPPGCVPNGVDCNDNGLPDSCEPAGNDCDANGVPDDCDTDCDGNAAPDACELADNDCNGNGVLDACEVDSDLPIAALCVDAVVACTDVTLTGATLGTGSDGTASCGNADASNDVWYTYTPSADGSLTASLCNASFDSVLSVHDGCPGTGDVELACDDNGCGAQSEVTMPVTAGTTYYLRVSGADGDAGDYELLLTGPACVNDPYLLDCNANRVPDTCDVSGPRLYEATNLGAVLPPAGDAGATEVSVDVPLAVVIRNLVVTLDLTHDFVKDLDAVLISPAGTSVRLFTNLTTNGANFIDTRFDDAAAMSITDALPPYTGTFRPVESLSILSGESSTGTWTLKVTDSIARDTGTINRFGVEFPGSPDCNGDGVPDECQTDCNDNDVSDDCDLAAGTSADCNGNNIPDECDATDTGGAVSVVAYDMVNGASNTALSLSFHDELYDGTGGPLVDSDSLTGGLGQLTDGVTGVSAIDEDLGDGAGYEWVGWDAIQPEITFDLGEITRVATISIHVNNARTDGVGLFGSVDLTFSDDGVNFGDLITYTTTAAERADTSARFMSIDIPRYSRFVRATFSDQVGYPWILISEVRFTARPADCNDNDVPDECDLADGTSTDCNGNAVPDDCEIDCDDNGIPDDCDLADGTYADCNENDVPDTCDIADVTSDDCNGNSLPDECEIDVQNAGGTYFCTQDCEADCDADGVLDTCELAAGTGFDCNGNDLLDACEIAVGDGLVTPQRYAMPNGESESLTLTYHDDTYTGGGDVTVDGDPLSDGLGQLTDGRIGGNNPVADLGFGAGHEWVGWTTVVPDITFDFGQIVAFELISIHANNESAGSVGLFASVELTFSDDGVNFGSPIIHTTTATERSDLTARFIEIPVTQSARYVRAVFTAQGGFGWVLLSEVQFDAAEIDCDGDLVPDVCQIDATSPDPGGPFFCATGCDADCDGNGVPDACATDCNDNDVPDVCDIANDVADDCNGNGVPDSCDIDIGVANDCNDDGVPDKCQLVANDCDANGIPDECDADCDANTIPDACDILGGAPDCNNDDVPDACEIDETSSAPGGPFFCTTGCDDDCNDNGIPDACDPDADSDGIPDGCVVP